jgi:hypothetical protein
MRRIVAQSVCLAIAYPDTAIARDAEAVYALYAPLLGVADALAVRRRLEALAASENPSQPAPANLQNLALARCTLFAEQKKVLAAFN